MNRFASVVFVLVLLILGLAVFLHLNPHWVPRSISQYVPGFQVPEAKSPVSNFRPPSF